MILLDRMMQEKLTFSILIWKEKIQSRSGVIRSDIGHLILSLLGWNPGWCVCWGKGHSLEGSNIYKGFMRMAEDFMNAESMGMSYWHTSQLQGGDLYWPHTTCLGGGRTSMAERVGSIADPELRLLDPHSM